MLSAGNPTFREAMILHMILQIILHNPTAELAAK